MKRFLSEVNEVWIATHDVPLPSFLFWLFNGALILLAHRWDQSAMGIIAACCFVASGIMIATEYRRGPYIVLVWGIFFFLLLGSLVFQ